MSNLIVIKSTSAIDYKYIIDIYINSPNDGLTLSISDMIDEKSTPHKTDEGHWRFKIPAQCNIHVTFKERAKYPSESYKNNYYYTTRAQEIVYPGQEQQFHINIHERIRILVRSIKTKKDLIEYIFNVDHRKPTKESTVSQQVKLPADKYENIFDPETELYSYLEPKANNDSIINESTDPDLAIQELPTPEEVHTVGVVAPPEPDQDENNKIDVILERLSSLEEIKDNISKLRIQVNHISTSHGKRLDQGITYNTLKEKNSSLKATTISLRKQLQDSESALQQSIKDKESLAATLETLKAKATEKLSMNKSEIKRISSIILEKDSIIKNLNNKVQTMETTVNSLKKSSPGSIIEELRNMLKIIDTESNTEEDNSGSISHQDTKQLLSLLASLDDKIENSSAISELVESLEHRLQTALQSPHIRAEQALDQQNTIEAIKAISSHLQASKGGSKKLRLSDVHGSLHAIIQAAWAADIFNENRALFEELLSPLNLSLILPVRGDSYSVRRHRREGRKNVSGFPRNKILEVSCPGIATSDGEAIEKASVIVSG